jgi:hypothetical protein
MRSLLVASLLVCVGCAGEDTGVVRPSFGEGAADGIDSVRFHGSLVLGTPINGAFTKNNQFDGYLLDVRAGAKVKLEITHGGSSMSLDTTLFVYGPADAAGDFTADDIAFDNDAGYGKLSKLTHTFEAAGRYAVVIGTKNAKGRGKYRLVPTCLSGECAPIADLPLGGCPSAIADKMLACVRDNVGEYEPLTLWMNFAEQCADADVLAPIYDQTCPGGTHCLGSFEAFYDVYAPACIRDVKNTILDGFCVFGTTYHEIETMPSMHLVEHTRLTSATGLSTLEKAQIVSAMKQSAHDDVTTATQAFERADSNEIFRRRWYDSSSRQAYTSFEYGSGDNSFGRIFPAASSAHVAEINDGDIYPQQCSVKVGPEIRDCSADVDCKTGTQCHGASDDFSRGVCLNTAADTATNEGATCTSDVACGATSGLLCAGLSRGDEGLCLPAWQRRGFVSEPQLAIPDNQAAGTTAMLHAYGLATVDMDVWLKLQITHPRAADLVITLENPATATVTIPVPAGVNVDLDIPVLGFSGDESVNGAWTLKVVDKASGQSGTIDRVELVIGSRWD